MKKNTVIIILSIMVVSMLLIISSLRKEIAYMKENNQIFISGIRENPDKVSIIIDGKKLVFSKENN